MWLSVGETALFHRRDGNAAEIVSESAECVKRAGSAAFEVAHGSFLEIVKANVVRKRACLHGGWWV